MEGHALHQIRVLALLVGLVLHAPHVCFSFSFLYIFLFIFLLFILFQRYVLPLVKMEGVALPQILALALLVG